MSGDEIRDAAIVGDWKEIKKYLSLRCNPCSTDQYGLSALHYAVWNGHSECVKYLIVNSYGVDKAKIKRSSVNLKSCMGLTALHLAAMETPQQYVQEITFNLLLIGANRELTNTKGETALQIAINRSNNEFIAAHTEYIHLVVEQNEKRNNLQNESITKTYLDDGTEVPVIYNTLSGKRKQLVTKYSLSKYMRTQVEKWKDDFEIPEFLLEPQQAGVIPIELTIHEHQIKPLLEQAFFDMNGNQSLHCLRFAKQQAEKSHNRLGNLVKISDETWDTTLIKEPQFK